MKPAKLLAIAAGDGNVAAVEQILRADPALAKDWQPIMDACFNGQVEVVKILLQHGADPSPAVGYAFWSLKDPALADCLLASGGKLDSGDTIVHTVENGPGPLVDLFVKHGVDLNDTRGTEHHGGYTPLGCVLTMRKTEGVPALFALGVDPNLRSGEKNETALHVAAKYACAATSPGPRRRTECQELRRRYPAGSRRSGRQDQSSRIPPGARGGSVTYSHYAQRVL